MLFCPNALETSSKTFSSLAQIDSRKRDLEQMIFKICRTSLHCHHPPRPPYTKLGSVENLNAHCVLKCMSLSEVRGPFFRPHSLSFCCLAHKSCQHDIAVSVSWPTSAQQEGIAGRTKGISGRGSGPCSSNIFYLSWPFVRGHCDPLRQRYWTYAPFKMPASMIKQWNAPSVLIPNTFNNFLGFSMLSVNYNFSLWTWLTS